MSPYPELVWLAAVVGETTGRRLSTAPGGWRGLSIRELDNLGLSTREKRSILALQRLTALGYPSMVRGELSNAEEVIRVYAARLSGLCHEVLLAIALDGQSRFMGEYEVSRGGRHGAAVMPADIFRPLIRASATAVILVHNHPSGDPQPSAEDVALTSAASLIGGLLGIPVLDHVIIGANGGGAVSLWQMGLISPEREKAE
ncbi:MAG TPA: JAB domain-containing protein [Polyangiaceae bacterium]|jgi:DNA repair protein RadC|nr:JAB domain-containing protein [Polyangiaceae bacterium]